MQVLSSRIRKMSDYLKNLSESAKERYLQKLKLIGLKEQEDPYAISEKFVDDMTLWPPVEYGHIFVYFIQRPGVYTQKELMQWKSTEAYNYFQSGHVQQVMVLPGTDKCILKAKVNPSQRSSDQANEAWLSVKKDGQVVCAHCTCMAGYVGSLSSIIDF